MKRIFKVIITIVIIALIYSCQLYDRLYAEWLYSDKNVQFWYEYTDSILYQRSTITH